MLSARVRHWLLLAAPLAIVWLVPSSAGATEEREGIPQCAPRSRARVPF
jgi:hypothetical protein